MRRIKSKPPKSAHRLAVAAQRERGKTRKAVTSVTAEQFMARHQYCVTIKDQLKAYVRSAGYEVLSRNEVRTPNGTSIIIKAACDHPEDGLCFCDLPNEEQLKQINDKLGYKYSHKEEAQEVQDDVSSDTMATGVYVEPPEPKQLGFRITIGG